MTGADEARTEPEIGSRVHVLSADSSKELGYGTYMGQVPTKDIPDEPLPSFLAPSPEPVTLTDDERAFVGAMVESLTEEGATTPKIVLDSGETVYGFQCWWSVVDEEKSAGKSPAIGTIEGPKDSFS